jgi:hypothetical protein
VLAATLGLLFEGQPTVIAVNRIAIEKHRTILVDWWETGIFQRCEYGGVNRMYVQRHSGVRALAVQCAM